MIYRTTNVRTLYEVLLEEVRSTPIARSPRERLLPDTRLISDKT